jgi:hypothetical protein
MKISGTGALVGAAIGAGARSAVVLLNLGESVPLVFVLPSAAIGVLVGLIAGGTAKPLVGALVGAVLSAIVFELFMLPCASLIGTFGLIGGDKDAEGKFLRQTVIYALEMGVAGLVAGGIGGWIGSRADQAKRKVAKSAGESENRA